MTYSEAIHSQNGLIEANTSHSESSHHFVQQARARLTALKQMAEEVTQELGLPLETKYDVLAAFVASGKAETVPLVESDAADILRQYDEYILTLARRCIPRHAVPLEILDLEIDELAQRVRIKLWQALEHHHVMSLKPYIRTILHGELVDMLRKWHPVVPLFFDADGELSQGHLMGATSKDAQDPAETLEQAETISQLIATAAEVVRTLPPRQRLALLCSLNDEIGNLVPWPAKKQEVHLLRASLSLARKKLRKTFNTSPSPNNSD